MSGPDYTLSLRERVRERDCPEPSLKALSLALSR
jgi:hypothetical protein